MLILSKDQPWVLGGTVAKVPMEACGSGRQQSLITMKALFPQIYLLDTRLTSSTQNIMLWYAFVVGLLLLVLDFIQLGSSYATLPRLERRTLRNFYQNNYPYPWVAARVVYDL
jgi:hypothetical protein